jgi:hypothetical protein
MHVHAKKLTVIAALALLELVGTLWFAILGETAWALAAGAILLFLLMEVWNALQPWRDERCILNIVHAHHGHMTVAEFERALENQTDAVGPYSGEKLEDLRDAVSRLVQNQRLATDDGVVHVQ